MSSPIFPLILFTYNFPFGVTTENAFLQVEIEYLAKAFKPLILVPRTIQGERCQLPDGVLINDKFSQYLDEPISKPRQLAHLLRTRFFYRELFLRFPTLVRPFTLLHLARATHKSLRTKLWVEDFLKNSRLPRPCVFYTYWLKEYTLGVGLARQGRDQLYLVSRAHGGDLYENRYQPAYLPLQRFAVQSADRVLAVSANGRDYLQQCHPRAVNLGIARLGVRGPAAPNCASTDGGFRIVSCSTLNTVKRLDLLVRGLSLAAQQRPDLQFTWDHFGDGPEAQSVRSLACQSLPENVAFHFHGFQMNETVLAFYRDNPVDVFVNVSSSEGIPVSVMEAASFGIPIIATAVGGTPEIVSAANGRLLSSDPAPQEISAALLFLFEHPQLCLQMRASSRRIWEELFNADKNFPEFTKQLLALASEQV